MSRVISKPHTRRFPLTFLAVALMLTPLLGCPWREAERERRAAEAARLEAEVRLRDIEEAVRRTSAKAATKAAAGEKSDTVPQVSSKETLPVAELPAASIEALRPRIDKLVQHLVKDKKGVGLVVGVVTQDGQHVFGYGQVKLAGERQPGGDTIFEIGSVTKVFTTLLLADMVHEKLVRLDDPVQGYLPNDVRVPTRDGKEITLLHLATHTSGLPRLFPALEEIMDRAPKKDQANPYTLVDNNDLYRALSGYRLEHEIGAKEDYSNVGMGLLGHALTRRAGAKSYEDLVVKRIGTPLRLKDTRIKLSAEQEARFPPAHTVKGEPTAHWDFRTLDGCGALRSTAADLLRFAAANLGLEKSSLLPAMLDCHQLHDVPGGTGLRTALGWVREGLLFAPKGVLWHNGGTYGAHSFLGIVPKTKTGVVILSNADAHDDVLEMAGALILSVLQK
jgi:CubicO group peptidase (beta-lactamase class C family)